MASFEIKMFHRECTAVARFHVVWWGPMQFNVQRKKKKEKENVLFRATFLYNKNKMLELYQEGHLGRPKEEDRWND